MHIVIILFFLMASVCHAEEPQTVNQELDEVVVTASRVEEKVKEVPVTTNIIKEKELETIKLRNPADVLNRIPGTYTNDFGGENELTSIRVPTHFTNPYTIILVDGIPTTSYGSGSSSQMRGINVRNIKRIEIIKGPSSALYGSNAIGGIVNIITKDPSPEPQFDIWAEYGEYDQWRGGVFGSKAGEKLSFNFDVNYANARNWRDNSSYDKGVGSIKLQYAPTDVSLLGFNLDYINLDHDLAGSLKKVDFEENWRHSYHTFANTTMDKITPTLIYNHFFDTSEFKAVFALRDIDHEVIPNYGIGERMGVHYGRLNQIEGLDANLQLLYSHDFKPWRSRVIAGIDTERDNTETDTYDLILDWDPVTNKYISYTLGNLSKSYDITTKVAAPYLQLETSPLDPLRITAGARYDSVTYEVDDKLFAGTPRDKSGDKDFSEFTPKVGLTYDISSNINSFLSYSQGFVVPTTSQLLTANGANDQLNAEKATNYEIGLRTSFWNRKLDLDVSVYSMEIEDKIVKTGESWNDPYVNAGETSHRGVETVLVLRPHEKFSLAASYTYARNEYETYTVDINPSPFAETLVDYSGNTLPRSPDHHLNARLTFYPIIGLELELEVDDISSQYADDANTISYSRPTLWNLRGNYDWRDWSFWAHVTNLTDEEYASYVSWGSTDGDTYFSGSPRTFFVGLSYRWGS
jgi:outer membrane receptor protein involved in Fe transport